MTQNKTTKPSTPIGKDWHKKMKTTKLSPQEKVEATKALLKVMRIQDKNKAEFDQLGLDHRGQPKIEG